MFIHIKPDITYDTVILFLTGVTLAITAFILKKGNYDNARLNRLTAIKSNIYKQLEFHYSLLDHIKIMQDTSNFHLGPDMSIREVRGPEAFIILYQSLRGYFEETRNKKYDGKSDREAEELRIVESFQAIW
jgi:hypothetical protein